MSLFTKCEEYWPVIERAKKEGWYPYFKPIDSQPDHDVVINGKRMIMLGSNNYLGLTTHPEVKRAAIEATEKYGSGCTGSRFLNGTLDIHVYLEEELAEFFKKDECIAFSTGYQTNLGVISSLIHKGDYVITDKFDHASIIDGCKLSSGEMKRFVHNDMDSLEQVLKSIPKNAGKLIVVDGIFSMEGDIAKLPEIISLAKKYDAKVMVDDAHGVGVLGERGAGTAEHFGLLEEIHLIMGTFSKSFASLGGFVVGDSKVIAYIRHHARSLIFSASMPPSAVATVRKALEIIKREPERRERLWHNTRKMLDGFKKLGFNTGTSETPVIPIIIGEDKLTIKLWQGLWEGGIFVNPILPPAVPPKRSLLRTSYMATHTDEELDEALFKFEKIGKSLGII